MTDYADEIWADRCRERNEREWSVTLRFEMTCTVTADKDASDDELRELAEEAVRDWTMREACEVEVVDTEVVG